eukprot:TRINITY_DN60437_c0_g1_i1.p1 TRINITY_DN60437_c0_g1~~TRINITY_DN60437_c0_g1_i1.p1  ORF type:complete len:173 (-),score=29.28 TRINITY_DN60437_c0_g1_i1:89-607(-)
MRYPTYPQAEAFPQFSFNPATMQMHAHGHNHPPLPYQHGLAPQSVPKSIEDPAPFPMYPRTPVPLSPYQPSAQQVSAVQLARLGQAQQQQAQPQPQPQQAQPQQQPPPQQAVPPSGSVLPCVRCQQWKVLFQFPMHWRTQLCMACMQALQETGQDSNIPGAVPTGHDNRAVS